MNKKILDELIKDLIEIKFYIINLQFIYALDEIDYSIIKIQKIERTLENAKN